MTIRNKIAACGLGMTLALSVFATPAFADTAQVQAARERLEALGQELSGLESSLETAADDLENTKSEIEATQGDVDAATEKLSQAQSVLAARTRVNYKAGSTQLLDVILGSSNFEDLITRVYYMDKVADQDAAAIADVKASKAELEAKQIELAGREQQQQQQLDDLSAQVESYQSRVQEAQEVYNALDEADKAELAKAAEEEQAKSDETGTQQTSYLQTAVESAEAANNGQIVSAETVTSAAARPSTSTNANTSTSTNTGSASTSAGTASGSTGTNTSTNAGASAGTTSGTTGSTNTDTNANAGSTSSSTNANTNTNTSTNTNTGSTSTNTNTSTGSGTTSGSTSTTTESNKTSYDYSSGDPVTIAMQFVGKVPYVSGGNSPETGLDCSGLVKFVYGKCGVTTPRTTGTIESWLKSRGTWKTSMSELNYGDIIFTSSGHVGIYAGNGYIIDAPVPGRMVAYRKVWSFYGGGSPW